ncbi:MAG: RDD family protein [Alphaproteobacteria bacterium]|nr:RDD family protein [Alphaproteobacteria bacterium]
MAADPASAGLPVRYAGIILRTVAGLVDLGIIWLFAWGVAALFGLPFMAGTSEQLAADTTSLHMLNAVVLFFAWLYFAGMEASGLQSTVGMAIMGIYTADIAGDRAGFFRTSARYWARFISLAILFLGFLPILFSPRRQALHDMLAGCTLHKR